MLEEMWWRQSGPSLIFEDILSKVGQYPVVAVACPPRTPWGFNDVLLEQLALSQFYRVVLLSWDDAEPVPTLLGTLITGLDNQGDVRSYRNLMPFLERVVLLLPGITSNEKWEQVFRDLPSWITAHRQSSNPNRPTLIVMVPENLAENHGLGGFSKSDVSLVSYRDYAERIDMLSFTHDLAPRQTFPNFFTPRFFETLVADFCGWDADLAAELISWDYQKLLDPWGAMVELAKGTPFLQQSWSSGGTSPFQGEIMVSPLVFAASNDRENFDRALWKAQATQIFPWLEYRRLDLCDHINQVLTWPLRNKNGGLIDRAEDAELGSLFYHYRHGSKCEPRVQNFLRAAGEARNDLAHRRPLTAERLMKLNNGCKQLPRL